LRKQKINTERSALVLQEALELRNLLSEHVWRVSDTSNDTETSGICDSSSELRAGGNVHARKQDRMVDLQEIGRDRSDLLCVGTSLVNLSSNVSSREENTSASACNRGVCGATKGWRATTYEEKPLCLSV
jgi:hypothetical protein